MTKMWIRSPRGPREVCSSEPSSTTDKRSWNRAFLRQKMETPVTYFYSDRPLEVKVRVEANRPPITYTSETLQRLEAKREEAGAARPGETREVTVLDGYSMVLRGFAFNNLQVADFMENLRKIGVFSDVDFVVTQADRFQQARVFNFEVTANVKL